MGWTARLAEIWPHVAVVLTLFVSIVTSGYVILYKRDSRSAIIWVAFIWLAPIIGSISYLAFGVNRIRLRARALRGKSAWYQPVPPTISKSPSPFSMASMFVSQSDAFAAVTSASGTLERSTRRRFSTCRQSIALAYAACCFRSLRQISRHPS